jgi:anti-anti-sigma regulatory factor
MAVCAGAHRADAVAGKFEAEVQQLDDFTYVKVAGVIDEDNELQPLAGRIRGRLVVIDLSTVRDVNNCGVRDWVKWRETVQGRGVAVVLVECSAAIVAKLNSVSNFNDGGFIKSFYVPYYCAACSTEKAMLVDMDEFRGEGPVRAPTCRCDSCDQVMQFDDMEESYFAFVAHARRLMPPDAIQSILDQLAPAAGERKILSGATASGSSFAGIPSTSGSARDFETGAGTGSSVSVASLRRLRDKSGVRTRRKSGQNPAPSADRSRRWLWIVVAVGGALLAIASFLLIVRATR